MIITKPYKSQRTPWPGRMGRLTVTQNGVMGNGKFGSSEDAGANYANTCITDKFGAYSSVETGAETETMRYCAKEINTKSKL